MRASITFWLVVVAIFAALLFCVRPKIGSREYTHPASTRIEISAFKFALNQFEVDTGHYPEGEGGLRQLLYQPRSETNWHGPWLDADAIPKDAWGHDCIYVCPGRHNPSSFDLVSAGPDGRMETDDDIGNWAAR